MAYFKNAQSYYLGTGMVRAAAGVYQLTSTLEQACLLEDVTISASTQHMITDITLAGQSIFASNVGCPNTAFLANAWVGGTGHKSIGVPLASRQQVVITGDAAPAVPFGPALAVDASCAIGTAPIDPEQVIPVNDLGAEAMSFVVGLGAVALLAGQTATLIATVRRPVMLGAMVLDWDTVGVNISDLTVESVTVNNVEMQSGLPGQAGETSFSAYTPQSSDIDGKVIGYPAALNSIVQVTVRSYSAANTNIAGCIFTLPQSS